MIYITGDIHGGYEVKTGRWRGFNKDEILIICGDFGYIFQPNTYFQELEQIGRDNFLDSVGCTVLWVDGN